MESVTTPSSQNATGSDVALLCHPVTPCTAVRRIQVHVRRSNASLELRYRVEGDLDRVLVPDVVSPQRVDNLWQHTCFEAFVHDPNAGGYFEFNFSPSGEWAIYQFTGYRAGMADVEVARPPRLSVHRESGVLQLDAVVDLESMEVLLRAEIKLALCAVIEESVHRMSYWALVHPAGKPDFHHADGFALKLSD